MSVKLSEARNSFFSNLHRSNIPKVQWNTEEVVKSIIACRVDDGGIPIFKTRYAGVPLSYSNSNAVMFVCWGGKNTVGSKMFYNVPDDIFIELQRRTDDWHFLLEKYAPEEYEKALKAPVFL